MHSIELLLDDATDAAIRRQWQALADASLPSQARHTGTTNAPHITLAARPQITSMVDDRLRSVARELPVPLELGPLVVFGRPPRGLVLARLVPVSTRILRLHAAVHDVLAASGAAGETGGPHGGDKGGGGDPHTREGHWTPHVTLASRLTPAQVAESIEVLAAAAPAPEAASASALRRWDSDVRAVTEWR